MLYRKPTHTDQNTYTTAHTTKQVAKKVLFPPPGLIKYIPLLQIKMTYTKKHARIKQVLKENGCQESIISEIFRRITNNHSLPQSQQLKQVTDIQEEEVKMSINLPCVEGTGEKLWQILRSHKISTFYFYTENTLSVCVNSFVKLEIE